MGLFREKLSNWNNFWMVFLLYFQDKICTPYLNVIDSCKYPGLCKIG